MRITSSLRHRVELASLESSTLQEGDTVLIENTARTSTTGTGNNQNRPFTGAAGGFGGGGGKVGPTGGFAGFGGGAGSSTIGGGGAGMGGAIFNQGGTIVAANSTFANRMPRSKLTTQCESRRTSSRGYKREHLTRTAWRPMQASRPPRIRWTKHKPTWTC